MICHYKWADPDRNYIYDLKDIISILDDEIHNSNDSSLKSLRFRKLYNTFKKCTLYLDSPNAHYDIDLNKIKKQIGRLSFIDLFEEVSEIIAASNIPDINELMIDIYNYYDEFKSLDSEIEYD